jgi:uncharacterized membrane protein YdbT with pleckstrin-like domain
MSVADFLISIAIFFLQNLILPILPVNFPFFSYSQLNNLLNSDLKNDIIYAFSGIGKLFPIKFLILMVVFIISAEIILAFVKIGKFIINLIRGSGA